MFFYLSKTVIYISVWINVDKHRAEPSVFKLSCFLSVCNLLCFLVFSNT